jgi:hypothetical protein
MTSIIGRLQSVRDVWTQAAKSPFGQQVRAAIAHDLPAFLLELGALTPMEARDLSRGLNEALANLIRTCGEEQKLLGSRHGRNALALRMSLARISGVLTPLEATLSSYALALQRSDPRMAAISLAYASPAAAAAPVAPDVAPCDCRQAADELRRVLRDIAAGAQRIQPALRGDRAADASVVAGAIEQAQVLVGWLRQGQRRCGAQIEPRPTTAQALAGARS